MAVLRNMAGSDNTAAEEAAAVRRNIVDSDSIAAVDFRCNTADSGYYNCYTWVEHWHYSAADHGLPADCRFERSADIHLNRLEYTLYFRYQCFSDVFLSYRYVYPA